MSSNSSKLMPVWLAILVNVNIVVGAGFFIAVEQNGVALGSLAPLMWLACGLLLLPLVNALAQLALKYPKAGGIYVFSSEALGGFWGLMSGWGYYIGTAAANAVVVHSFCKAVLMIAPIGAFFTQYQLAPAWCDVIVVVVFTLFNLRNFEFLERAQLAFTALKLLPILAILAALPVLFSFDNLVGSGLRYDGIMSSLPGMLFAFIGIEASCSVMDQIKDSKKNAARVIFISFAVIALIYAALQAALLSMHGAGTGDPFMTIPTKLFPVGSFAATWLGNSIHLGLLASFMAGFYGMFYFNNWNLCTMAKEVGIKQVRFLTRLNAAGVPWVAVLVQSVLVLALILGVANQNYVVAMSCAGTAIAYVLSAIAFYALTRSFAGILAIASCGVFLYVSAMDLVVTSGLMTTIPFFVLLFGVLALYRLLKK